MTEWVAGNDQLTHLLVISVLERHEGPSMLGICHRAFRAGSVSDL